MRRVKVESVPDVNHVPAYAVAPPHDHRGSVGINVAVDIEFKITICESRAIERERASRIGGDGLAFLCALDRGRVSCNVLVQIPALVLVNHVKERNEFTVHVTRRTVGTGHPARGYDDRADQTGVDIPLFVDVRMVEPDDGARIARARAGPLGDLPRIGVRLTRWNGAAQFASSRATVAIRHALVLLLVENTVRMHAV